MQQNQDSTGVTKKVTEVLSYVAALGMFTLMALVFISVFFRYVLNSPILATEDLMAILLGVTIFTAVPSVTQNRRHITVELLTAPFKRFPLAERIRRILVDAFVIVMTFYMSYLIGLQAFRFYDREELSLLMEWPLYPVTSFFAVLIFIGGFLFVLRALKDRGRHETKGGIDL